MKKSNLTIIIGNGFDIAAGHKTSYKNFIQSPFFINLRDNKLVDYIKNKLELEARWVDLEIELGNYSNLLIEKYGYDNKYINDVFYEDYSILREALFMYLKGTINGKRNLDLEKLLKSWLAEDETPRVVNFNYTIHFEGLYNLLKKDNYENFSNIHGRIDHNYDGRSSKDCLIQFGVDEGQSIPPNHYFIIKNNSIEVFKRYILASDKIIIYGSSFGITDARYFKLLLRIIEETKKKLIIYCYEENSFNEINLLAELS